MLFRREEEIQTPNLIPMANDEIGYKVVDIWKIWKKNLDYFFDNG